MREKYNKDGARSGADRDRSRKHLVTAAKAGAAIGIGSAALVAALLYANRDKDWDKQDDAFDPRFEPEDS
ncbi:hypothetical protein [uncultured Sphingomonas sp.]|uniref:hypothetical protein n=1 Tax=uncultured Sphingomonas sp. TaxID=158754 RepID=UPI0025FED463|nr:hypothetical protein [uncultured Sphingomonas sp.]